MLRRAAFRMLTTTARLAPAESRHWADAMLAELHHVEGEFPALRWALGSAAAVCRHSLMHLHPVSRLAGPLASRRTRLAVTGAVLLLVALAFFAGKGVSASRPANGGHGHMVSARVP